MYTQNFGLRKLPFRQRPDLDFVYSGPEYVSARAGVLGAFRNTAQVILLQGKAGVGKSLLLDDVLQDCGAEFLACRINQPFITAAELLEVLLMQFGGVDSDPGAAALTVLRFALDALVTQDRQPLLVIDDAHLMASDALNALAGLRTRTPQLKMLITGRCGPDQPANDAASPTAAAQVHGVRLQALGADSVKAYIDRRLCAAGGGDRVIFDADAVGMIHRQTAGNARLINVLCDTALQIACDRSASQVSAADVSIAAQDPRWLEAVGRAAACDAAHAPVDAGPRLTPRWQNAFEPQDAIPSDAPVMPAAGAPHVLIARGAQPVDILPLAAERLTIGRGSGNDLILDTPFVSRRHCVILRAHNGWAVEDLASNNGIFVNGRKIAYRLLQHGDVIAIGDNMVTFMLD
jgi:type II secretory pathway predicted ATPase ExeA